jgi:transcriptional regulator with XRE-family HTH domain
MTLTFGSWLRNKRAQQEMTQDELAHLIGISRRTLHYWESDMHLPYRRGFEQLLAHLPSDSQERESLVALLTLPAARGLAEAGAATQQGPVTPLLPMSELVWALRTRQGWTQEQMASEFGLCSVSVLRWEKGHNLPPDEMLHCLSTRLCVSEAERKALWRMRISRYGREVPANGERPLELCRMHVEQMERASALAQDPLFELYVLSLRRVLRRLRRKTEEAADLITRLEMQHGCWLFAHDRVAESHNVINGVLQQVCGRHMPQPHWLPALNVASANVRRLYGARAGVQYLLRWLPYLPNIAMQAYVLADSAVSALLAHDPQRANEMISIAQRMLPASRCAATQGYVRLSAARIELATRGDQDAWEAVMQETMSASERVHLLLIGASSAASTDASRAAADYLCRAQALLTPEMPVQLRRRFAELSQDR